MKKNCLHVTITIFLLAYLNNSFAQKSESILYQQTSEINNLMVQHDADDRSIKHILFIKNSPERREKLKTLEQSYLIELAKVDFDKLPVGSRVDYILFKRNLANELRLLAVEEKEYSQITAYIPFADSIYAVEKIRRRGASIDAELFATQLHSMQLQTTKLLQQLPKDTTLNMAICNRAVTSISSLQDALKNVFDFYNAYNPEFTWWIPIPYKATDSILTMYASAFREKSKATSTQKNDASGIVGNPIGREEILAQLHYEMIAYNPEELITIANKEFAWCEKELLKASEAIGFGNDWKAAQEKVKNTYLPAGEQPQAIMKLYNESVDFLKKNHLVTIPPLAEEDWAMNMLSPERQQFAPFFLGGQDLLVAYPTNTMKEADRLMAMRGNNPHFSRATVHHELVAGHHLQQYMNNRFKAYRNFDTPFWHEGNAVYWEFLLWDKGFPQSPEDKIGMLFWRMHRCARIIFSLNYHLGNWTPQHCIDFLVDRVGHERANAEGEVRRSFTGGYAPLYQIGYMIGAFQFWALKKELVDTGKMSFIDYHDAILHENAMPIEMLRAILTNKTLTKDYVASWQFYGR